MITWHSAYSCSGRSMGFMSYTVLAISLSAVFSDFVRPLPHVSHYEVVRPVKLNSRSKRSPSQQDGAAVKQYPDELQYQLFLDGRNHTVHLKKNGLLFGSNYSETHYTQDGTRVTTFPNVEDHCYYHGNIKGMEDSSISVGVCTGINGFLRVAQQVYLIEPLGVSPEGDHAVYKPQHMSGQTAACGLSNDTEDESAFIQPRAAGVFRPSGQNEPRFSTPRYVELYMVVDNAEFRRFQTLENVHERMQNVVNHINLYYRAVNIHVLLVGLEVWKDTDKFVVHGDEGTTLDRFLQWRLDDLVKRAHHDSAMFVTGIDFFSETVGFATRYAMCSAKSGGVNQDYHTNSLALAATIAHEMGHTLGMTHDEPGCSCGPTERNCLMVDTVSKFASTFPKVFSDCSLKQLSQFLESPSVSCLLEPPKADSLYGGARCGNGVVDTGEQCDCGPVEMCKNPCCDASTCRLTAGSQCADGQCCENCQLKQPGSVCRPAAHDCDLAEFCSGDVGACPEDSFKMNGAVCNYGDGYCYNGVCPSADGHCKRLWGPAARSPPECFHFNMKGEEEAHCGISGRTYKPCSDRDMVCGKLFCFGGNPHPFVGLPGYWTRDRPQCYYVRDNTDPNGHGMVPTGTKCGLNRVCYNHMCQDITVYGSQDCAEKCNNHGVCNHKGECHCDPGWAPPYCSSRGYTNYGTAGSGDSAVIIGVSAAGAVLVLLVLLVVAARLWKKRKTANLCKPKPQSLKLTPSYRRDQTSDSQLTQPLHISQPVFLETTSKRMDDPTVITVMPSRPPPSPPKNSPRLPSQGHNSQMRPMPPLKPSPAVPTKSAHTPMSPPVPPVKPSVMSGEWSHTQSGTAKSALRPPVIPR